jgi:hypothetical protein
MTVGIVPAEPGFAVRASIRIRENPQLTVNQRRLLRVHMSAKKQDQNNQQDRSNADRVITPTPAVRPNWKAPKKRYDKNYCENEQKGHGLATSVTCRTETFATSIRTELVT